MTLCISTYDEAAEPFGVFISKCNWQGKNDQDGISHEFWLTKPLARADIPSYHFIEKYKKKEMVLHCSVIYSLVTNPSADPTRSKLLNLKLGTSTTLLEKLAPSEGNRDPKGVTWVTQVSKVCYQR